MSGFATVVDVSLGVFSESFKYVLTNLENPSAVEDEVLLS